MAPLKYESFSRLVNLALRRLQKLKDTVEDLASAGQLNEADLKKLRLAISEVIKKRDDFTGNLTRVVESMSDDELNSSQFAKEQDEIPALAMDILSCAESLLPPEVPPSPSIASEASSAHQTPIQSHVNLPRLDLPLFDGDLFAWTSFINLYDSSIHRNPTLSNVLKFQYLLTTLTKEPLSIIRSLDITAENYPIAYQLLRDRYHNPRRLQALHLNAILDLPDISHGDTKRIRTFLNSYYEHSQALNALGVDLLANTNVLLAALLLRKMDTTLCRKLETYRTMIKELAHSFPEPKTIVAFLQQECSIVEDAGFTKNETLTRRKGLIAHKSQPRSQVTMVATSPKSHPSASTDCLTSQDISTPHRSSRTFKPHLSSSSPLKPVSRPSSNLATAQQESRPSGSDRRLPACFVCNQTNHRVYSCPTFKEMKGNDRQLLVRKQNRCTSCLGTHSLSLCRSLNVCQVCSKKHHTLLHLYRKDEILNPPSIDSQSQPTVKEHVAMASHDPPQELTQRSTTVLLGTALVQLHADNGRSYVFRCLLDSGSTSSFISERAAKILGGSRMRARLYITGIAQSSTQTRGRLDVNIKTLSGRLLATSQPMFILDRISVSLPRTQLNPEVFRRAQAFLLADPTFHVPSGIDVLLGGSLFPQLMTNESYSLGPDMPHVVGTQLGFVVMGEAPCMPFTSHIGDSHHSTTLLTINDLDLHASLQRFWMQEEPPAHTQKSEEETLCEEHYSSTHGRLTDGRYSVSLPFRPNAPSLGNSRLTAERRFRSLELKFKSQPHFKALYLQFMEEYSSLGHMTKLPDFDEKSPHYFMPHHGVLKEGSTTTKLRTVFDASCKTSNGLSLNDVLLQGPKLQTNICDLILQFRTHNIVFACDVKQMFRQICMDTLSRPFQCILWRSSPEEEISVYQLNTVTYGVNCSPYLAIRTLHQLAEDEGQDFPEAALVLRKCTYVDDILTGADSLTEAKILKAQLIGLLARGGFELRKWTSNEIQLIEDLPAGYLETPGFLHSADRPLFSILGLQWSPSSDDFSYQIVYPLNSCTKRQILSDIAKIYDPCGFLAPITMWCKCFMQRLWTLGIEWDDVLPAELLTKWKTFVSQLPLIEGFRIPRKLHLSHARSVQIHGFSDGSEAGFAAVVYLRCELSDGSIVIRPVIAKTRVAPLKKMTVPRLELCAAHLLAQLVSYCKTVFSHIPTSEPHLWCDSRVALTWLQTPSYQLKTYVANRVAQTQELVPSHWWHFIKSEHNAADCASRGVLPSHLKDLGIWWKGPEWLQDAADQWPQNDFQKVDLASTSEVKDTPLPTLLATTLEEWDLFTRFSSWEKLQRVIAYVLRFVNNSRRSSKQLGPLSVAELKSARLRVIKLIQDGSFAQDISALKRQLSPSSKLNRLSPFLDEDGLLRVGGRLSKSQLGMDAKHPLILPKHHHVVDLLINHYHTSHLHAGAQLTQALICQRYWILSARSRIRSCIFRCLKCFKLKPRQTTPMMADLPSQRVTPSKSFLSTGMDYAGPFTIKAHQLRGVKHLKSYLCIFVCLSTKAVHLEVVADLTSQSFIAALTRFICRRGKCADLYSDCGTNFLGAEAALRKTLKSLLSSSSEEVSRHVTAMEINFHFNPPAAPHFGGIWESAVKSAKHHLRRVLGNQVLTLPEFETLVVQVEAMLNSRPLTPLSADPNDLQALTPGHFLTGSPLVSVPEDDFHHVPINRLKNFQLVQAMNQDIWRRWQREYLHTLNQRSKWTRPSQQLKVGDMVLINSPSPPLTWPLGRVTQVFPGSDNIVRVVEVKTANGTLRRPVVKVSLLPMRE